MGVEVNGYEFNWVKNETVKQLLRRVRYTFPLVVIKISKQLGPRENYSDFIVPNNSVIADILMIS